METEQHDKGVEKQEKLPAASASSPMADQNVEEIQIVSKKIRLLPELPEFDPDFYEWKKDFWRNQMKHIKNVVAPMVDQSELAFRMFLRRHGADLCYTPMIHAHLFVNDFTYRKTAFSTTQKDRPLIVQFCANDPDVLLDACRLVEGYCDGVDLNLGCPQLIAERGRYGAYLQESPELISSMVAKVFKHCRLPLSAKIRVLDTVEQTIEYAKMIQDSGASMIAVHGRVRHQRGVHTGLADWTIIQKVKEALNIPVIANGNIQMVGDAERCLQATGVDAVMSAEGLLANPMLFDGQHVNSCHVASEYLEYADKYKAGVSAIRAHIFRICHYRLLKYNDLREKNSYIFTLDEFRALLLELEMRTQADIEQQGMEDRSWNSFVDELPKDLPLSELVEMTPSWFCKPYVRPHVSTDDQPAVEKTFRAQRNAELQKLSEELGISKRQLRRRERRQLESKKKINCKLTYPRCERCKQPASPNCLNRMCRKCCKWVCLRNVVNCQTHNLDHQTLLAKKKMYASGLGVTVEELLHSETTEDERIIGLKHVKREKNLKTDLMRSPAELNGQDQERISTCECDDNPLK